MHAAQLEVLTAAEPDTVVRAQRALSDLAVPSAAEHPAEPAASAVAGRAVYPIFAGAKRKQLST